MRGAAKPFRALGFRLRSMREQAMETVAEVSGAVEIDADHLRKYENGEQRPSEEVLELLINHFSLNDHEAERLYQLAGYDPSNAENKSESLTPTMMVMPFDVRVVYTDQVHVMANNYGVIMNFLQTAGPNNNPLAVARVGMSMEHAKSVLEILGKTIEQAEKENQPKALPRPSDKKTK